MKPLAERTARVVGAAGVERLAGASAAVFGIGGVGSYAAEALVRAGVGRLFFIDGDVVEETNLNRQLVADLTTLGRPKAEVMAERAARVNPDGRAEALVRRYAPGDEAWLASLAPDFVIDAVDDVPAKVSLAEACARLGIPEASSMGTGNRLRPELLTVSDIYDTSVDPLARRMRRELRARGVARLTAVWSRETPVKTGAGAVGSVSFVPPAAGMILAGLAVRSILGEESL